MSSTFESIFLQALSLSETSRHALAMALRGSLKSPDAAVVAEPPKGAEVVAAEPPKEEEPTYLESVMALAAKIPGRKCRCVECDGPVGGNHSHCFYENGYKSENDWMDASKLYTFFTRKAQENREKKAVAEPPKKVAEQPKKVAEPPKKVAEQVQQDPAESTKALGSKIPYEQTLCVACNRLFGGDHRRCFFGGGFNSEREWVEASQLYTLKRLSQSEREALEPKVVQPPKEKEEAQPPKETAAAEQPKEKALSDWQVHLAYVREGLYSADLCDEDKHLVKTGPCVMQIAKTLKADGKQNIFTHKELLAALEAWKAVSPEEREAQKAAKEAQKAAKKAEKEAKRAAKESAKQTKEVKKAEDAATDTESTTSSEKKKRVWTEEQKAKAKATREANKAKKAAVNEEGL